MPTVVFDSSALLALLWNEGGAEVSEKYQDDYIISSINAAEVFTKLIERNPSPEAQSQNRRLALTLNIVPFDAAQALESANLRSATRKFGLSLGDRACLALASLQGATVVTADRIWATLDIGVKVEVIR